jgi:hypothetical protein
MRRRPRDMPSTRRRAAPVSLNAEIRNLPVLPGDFSLLRRALQGAIDAVTERFEEAQREYHVVVANSRDWHKWKGEMIAYANVVALLEDLKSRASPEGKPALAAKDLNG